jgi:hypothetical protein
MGLHNPMAYLSIAEPYHPRANIFEEANVPESTQSKLENLDQLNDESAWCLVTIIAVPDDYQPALSKQPLSTRGWVIQKRLMTPRTRSFGKDRIYWQCHQQMLNEYMPYGLPGSGKGFDRHVTSTFSLPGAVVRHEPPNDLTDRELFGLYDYWYSLVDQYKLTNLMFPQKNKLAAIAAIATRFSLILGTYCAELFESNMTLG